MPNVLLRTSCRMIRHLALPLLLFVVLAVSVLRAQNVPCLGNGPAPNGWTRWDDSPVGRALRSVDQLQNDSSPQAADLYGYVLAAAEKLPDTDTCKARALFYVALYYKSRDPEKALALELRSVAIADSALPAGHPRRVLDARDLAEFYDTAHKPAEAERFYRQTLSLADSAPGLSAMERMFTFSTVAKFHDRRKEFVEAEALYRRALDASQGLPDSMGEWTLTMRAQLAHVLAEEGRQNESHTLLNEPSPPIPALPLHPGPDLSSPMSDLARAREYVREGDTDDAEISYLSAISTLEAMKRESMQVNLLLQGASNELSGLYHEHNRDAESEALLLRSFRLWAENASAAAANRKAPFQPLPSFPWPNLQPLMLMYEKQGRLSEIEPLYLRAIDLQERLRNKDDFGISIMLTDLAHVYCHEGRYEAALPLYQRVLAIQEAKWGPDDVKLASILDQYADALEKLNRPDEASGLRARSARLTAAARQN